MKLLTIIFCLFLLASARAQSYDPLYIVDNKEVASINDLKSKDIIETTVLPDSIAIARYGQKAAHGAMIVTTIKGATAIYQKKFFAFNKRYQSYIDKRQGDDSKLSYVINNTILINGTKKTVMKLYDLQPGDIKKIDYRTDRRFTTDATIVIKTNDDN